ncbi:MAG: hypothetical protein ABEI52_10545, partial [Halobacteriaceae archaeon]
WHMNEVESAAMWDLYTTRGYGIAVTTTVEQYLNEISQHEFIVHAGPVNYINYRNTSIPRYDTLAPAFHKRTSFAHEREFRGVIQELPYFLKAVEYHRDVELLKSDIEEFSPDPDSGISVQTDTGELIDKIYVAPDTPSWRKSVVETIAESFSDLGPEDVTQSSLEEDPVF